MIHLSKVLLLKNKLHSCDVWIWEYDTVFLNSDGTDSSARRANAGAPPGAAGWRSHSVLLTACDKGQTARWYLVFPAQDAATNIKLHFLFINYSNHLFTRVTNTQIYRFVGNECFLEEFDLSVRQKVWPM